MNLHSGHHRPSNRPGLTLPLRRVGLVGALGLLAALLVASPSLATVPGPNGLIAFRADTGSGNQI
ncbi:MAG TPA: hypothetical protein VEQ37_06230 [Actinomycetota bacterium]|nr:hypothetical protein [Actinomycetota bacterium]